MRVGGRSESGGWFEGCLLKSRVREGAGWGWGEKSLKALKKIHYKSEEEERRKIFEVFILRVWRGREERRVWGVYVRVQREGARMREKSLRTGVFVFFNKSKNREGRTFFRGICMRDGKGRERGEKVFSVREQRGGRGGRRV